MRARIIKAVFGKELTELLRNRRSLVVMFGVPLLLYPILTIAVASLTESKQQEMVAHHADVLLIGSGSAPHLVAMMNDPTWGIRAALPGDGDIHRSLHAGVVDAAIEIPFHYEADQMAMSGLATTAPATTESSAIQVELDRSRPASGAAETKLDKLLDAYQHWIIEQRLARRGIGAGVIASPPRTTIDIATSNQNFGTLLAQMLPVLLLLTGMLGALYPALSATTTERELGTMETLLVTPATRNELLTAKAGIVLISGMLTALLNMISMSLVLWRVLSQAHDEKITAGFSIDPRALALSYLAAIPTLIFFTSLVLMVGLLARNLREANAYATPVMLIPIASMLVGIADPVTTPALLVTPVINTTVIIKDVLTGHVRWGDFALAFISSSLYAGLVLSLAGRIFTNEQLVNPEWEPLSLRGFGRRTNRPRRWPAVDEVLVLFSLSLLLNFYLTPSLVKFGLIVLLLLIELLIIALPAIVFAILGRYRWREVFSLRPPTAMALIGAAMMGVGLIPAVDLISWAQAHWHLLPPSAADAEGMAKLFKPALLAHPILTPILTGLSAGVCEEILFRGPIQSALLRRLGVPMALVFGAFLFAAAHVDLSGMPIRFGLGLLLGWIVWHTGSIVPAMLLHATYDGVQIAIAAYQLRHGVDAMTNTPAFAHSGDWIELSIGMAMTMLGAILLWRARRRSIDTENGITPENQIAPPVATAS